MAGTNAKLACAIAITVITAFEGRELVAYLDPVGIPTICDGITQGVKLGDVKTPEQCDQLMLDHIDSLERELMSCMRIPENPNQRAAVLSWAYNVGSGSACNSTLARMVNEGANASSWCAQLKRWVYAKGKFYRGLERRREAEYKVCIG